MQDLIKTQKHTERLFELVDGVLVEKVMGFLESSLAMWLGALIQDFLHHHDLGVLAGPDGTFRLMPGLVRIPDVSFVSWDRLPLREIPTDPVPNLVPDLAVEVLSGGNTPGEMRLKLKDYFLAGTSLVWFVDPIERTVQVYTAPDQYTVVTEDEVLDGGAVLPGLSLPLRQVFARLPGKAKTTRPAAGKARKRRKGG